MGQPEILVEHLLGQERAVGHAGRGSAGDAHSVLLDTWRYYGSWPG